MGDFANREEVTLNGKLYHKAPVDPRRPDDGMDALHEGEWLKCDGCNPAFIVPVKDDPATGTSRIIALRATYGEANRKAKAAADELKNAKSKLQAAIRETSETATRYVLNVPGFSPILLTYSEPWGLNTERLKAEKPAVYVEYAEKGTRWTMTEAKVK